MIFAVSLITDRMLNIFNMDNFNEPGEQTENNDEYTHGQHTKS